MGIVVREVATLCKTAESGSFELLLSKNLIPGALDGLTSWSHCWLVYLLNDQVQLRLFRTEKVVGKRIFLSSTNLSPLDNLVIIDIKPVHYCDLARVMHHDASELTMFGKPEISLDSEGFDSWTSQGVIRAPPVCGVKTAPLPDWLNHTELKSPWLYVEKSTPHSHLGYSDLGDLQYVHTNGSCSVPQHPFEHPSIVLNQPSSKLHVKLEDITNTVHPKVLWDESFQLRNTAPGGLGVKVVGYQKSIPNDTSVGFVPFCFKNIGDVNFFDTKYRLTTESVAEPADAAVKAFKDVAILRPRPLCDVPLLSSAMPLVICRKKFEDFL